LLRGIEWVLYESEMLQVWTVGFDCMRIVDDLQILIPCLTVSPALIIPSHEIAYKFPNPHKSKHQIYVFSLINYLQLKKGSPSQNNHQNVELPEWYWA